METIELECEICGKKYTKTYTRKRVSYSKACSSKCFKLLMSKIRKSRARGKIICKNCKWCGKEFKTDTIKNRNNCSHKCGYEYRKSKTEYIEIICKCCGKNKKVYKKRYEYYKKKYGSNVFNYCSIKCALKNNKSGFETDFEMLLKELNINYITQFTIKKFSYDFYLPNYNILIECQGDYWHGNKRTTKNLSDKQIYTRKKDKRKYRLAKRLRYSILYIWENQFRKNISKIKNLLIQKINTLTF